MVFRYDLTQDLWNPCCLVISLGHGGASSTGNAGFQESPAIALPTMESPPKRAKTEGGEHEIENEGQEVQHADVDMVL